MSDNVERRFIGEDPKTAYAMNPGLELRAEDSGKQWITGYGAVFNSVSRNLGGFVEIIDPGAFQRAMTEGYPGAVARYNHDSNMLLGTIGGRTMSLRIDRRMGLWYEVLPPQSRADILELVARGDIRHSSFAFRVAPGGDEWTVTDTNYPLRRVHDVDLVDVAPVVNPAYVDSTAGLRSLATKFSADPEEVRRLAEADELRRFFVRTDPTTGRLAPKPKKVQKPGIFGPLAMADLANRKEDPYSDDLG
jgi:HK97 family phage prohead protease